MGMDEEHSLLSLSFEEVPVLMRRQYEARAEWLLQQQQDLAKKFIKENQSKIRLMASELLAKEILSKEDLQMYN